VAVCHVALTPKGEKFMVMLQYKCREVLIHKAWYSSRVYVLAQMFGLLDEGATSILLFVTVRKICAPLEGPGTDSGV
jgi:hypothetical protein